MYPKNGSDFYEERGIPITGAIGGSLAGAQLAPPPQPGSLSSAFQRLQKAILANGELTSQVGQRLEASGFLRSDVPQATQGNGRDKASLDSALAYGVNAAAEQIESTNMRLVNLVQRIDG